MEITKQGAQSLRMKMPTANNNNNNNFIDPYTAELYLKEAAVIYGFYLLTARLPVLG